MTLRKTMFAIAAPFAVAAAIGTTAVFAQSGDESPTPSTETPPATAPESTNPGTGGRHHGGGMKDDCPEKGGGSGGSDTGSGTSTSTQY